MIRIHIALLCFFALFCSSCGKEKNVPLPVSPVTFAVIGNTGLTVDNGLAFSALTGAINKSGAEFAVDLGNRLPPGAPSTGLKALWLAVDRDMEKFAAPVYPVPGVHDIFDAQSDAAYGEHYGPLWYSFVRGGTTFVVLHTGDEAYRTGFGHGSLHRQRTDRMARRMCQGGSGRADGAFHEPAAPGKMRPVSGATVSCRLSARRMSYSRVSASDDGLCDWGKVDGIRAVTTGCTGPTGRIGPGLFPSYAHCAGERPDVSFRVLLHDGSSSDKIEVDQKRGNGTTVSSSRLPFLPWG